MYRHSQRVVRNVVGGIVLILLIPHFVPWMINWLCVTMAKGLHPGTSVRSAR